MGRHLDMLFLVNVKIVVNCVSLSLKLLAFAFLFEILQIFLCLLLDPYIKVLLFWMYISRKCRLQIYLENKLL
jgi:hypothetical protein